MIAYNKLVEHSKKIFHFNHLAAICSWDQASVMPAGGNHARSEAMAELTVHIHRLMTDPKLPEWFDQAENESLNTQERASLRELRKNWMQANVLPQELVQKKSLAGSKCEHAWRTQRGNNDWQDLKIIGKKLSPYQKKKRKFDHKRPGYLLTTQC